MFKNYLRTSVIYLSRHRGPALINLIGLVTGFTVCFFALVYIGFELSYDTYHHKAGRTYRLVTDVRTTGDVEYKGSSAPMAPEIARTFPEVEEATRIGLDYYTVQTEKDQVNFYEEKIAYADSSLFSVFDFRIISGDVRDALKRSYSVVLSETTAKKYFGSSNALNRILILDGKFEMTVSAIMEDMPLNSHFNVDILVSMPTLLESWWKPEAANNWRRLIFHTYLVLPEDYDYTLLERKFPDLIKSHISEGGSEYTLALEPLTDVYLHGKPRSYRSGSITTGNLEHLYFFGVVAAFVLFIACFNFVNLTTAFSISRAKEIGLRKVLGATKLQLRYQLLFDSVLLSLIAFVLTVAVSSVFLPFFVHLIGKNVGVDILDHAWYVGVLFLISFLVGFFSGIYPAFFLTDLETAHTLRGKFAAGSGGIVLRKLLTTTQFAIAVFLIIATTVVYRQLNYMQQIPLGFAAEQKLVIDFHFDGRIKKQFEALRQQLAELHIDQLSLSSAVPGRPGYVRPIQLENSGGMMQEFQMDAYFIDFNFLDLYGIETVEGRSLSAKYAYDSVESVMINETAAKALGYADARDALGKTFIQGDTGLIVGVVKDFHFHALREKIQPLFLRKEDVYTFLTLTIPAGSTPEIIDDLGRKWTSLIPGLPLSYFFLDEEYNNLYAEEKRFGKIFIISSAIALIVCCLGLLGLYTFTISQRTKEIGIRKVLGSSVAGIVLLLIKDFFYVVALAFLMAGPAAWISMTGWLDNFAYRIDLSLWMFTFAVVLVVLVGVVTIGLQTLRAAVENPVKSLRSE